MDFGSGRQLQAAEEALAWKLQYQGAWKVAISQGVAVLLNLHPTQQPQCSPGKHREV